jgi:phage baseplate assembly protein V
MTVFRVGIVEVQDPAGCRVRVKFPDRDQLQSWWLPIVVGKTQNDKAYYLPDVGEQVVCLMDEYDEDGAVLGAIYSTADLTPPGMTADKLHWTAKDGATLEYDRALHSMVIALPSGGSVNISANGATISIDSGGNVNVSGGNINVVAAGQINLGSGALKGVARLGDTVVCPAGTGTISSSSTKVLAD